MKMETLSPTPKHRPFSEYFGLTSHLSLHRPQASTPRCAHHETDWVGRVRGRLIRVSLPATPEIKSVSSSFFPLKFTHCYIQCGPNSNQIKLQLVPTAILVQFKLTSPTLWALWGGLRWVTMRLSSRANPHRMAPNPNPNPSPHRMAGSTGIPVEAVSRGDSL